MINPEEEYDREETGLLLLLLLLVSNYCSPHYEKQHHYLICSHGEGFCEYCHRQGLVIYSLTPRFRHPVCLRTYKTKTIVPSERTRGGKQRRTANGVLNSLFFLSSALRDILLSA